jgi:hypothetical protein
MDQRRYSNANIKRALHIYVFFKIVNLVLAFGFQILVVKILSPPHFATYAVLLALLMSGERFLSFGIDRTILRFVPALASRGDDAGLRGLGGRVVLLRMASLVILAFCIFYGSQFLKLPVALDAETTLAFAIWFIAYILFVDADAFAQSVMAHAESAFISTLEVMIRVTVVLLVRSYLGAAEVKAIIVACAMSSTIASILLCYRLGRLSHSFRTVGEGDLKRLDPTFDTKRAPMFALANYSSTLSYLISSPPVIRLIATAGLDVTTLAAFSFIQGLYISVQRVLPGLLVLPTIEPIVMSQLGGDVNGERIYAGLSLLFKAELICTLSVLLAVLAAGHDIVEILSKPAYAPYYFILPLFVCSLIFSTTYRIFELIANMNFRQSVFFLLWPIGVCSMLALYETVSIWGLWSVLFWPLLEIIARIGVLAGVFHTYSIARAFDPVRSILLVLMACAIVALVFLVSSVNAMGLSHFNLYLALAGPFLFISSLFLCRPLRPAEYETLTMIIPATWRWPRKVAWRMTRPIPVRRP